MSNPFEIPIGDEQLAGIQEKLTPRDSIYATGVFLEPYQRSDGKWTWRVMCFEDDSYLNGNVCNPTSECIADTCEGLLWVDEDEQAA